MATVKYFSDFTGEPVEIPYVWGMRNSEFSAKFGNLRGIRNDSFSKLVGNSADGVVLPVTRVITRKSFPSMHECNSKCINGRHNGTCECRCGGRNHGAGMFTKLLEAA